jgi:ABC-type multidrug transport system fused ATPase/permease subunit
MGLDKFIESLRMGIDTPLGNNGKSFPQKQRQLLSLAYAISQAPKLLLVDNCLSELSFDEKVPIFRFALSKGMTIILSDVDSDALATLIN